ncbi:MAG TPA: hypothetical protein VJ732_12990 [Bryobacteraceae bacterium]|nr:hypothetical protein [Bryobacteraceae bacterium]
MIEKLTANAGSMETAQNPPATGKTVLETPFGDMVAELSGPDSLAALFSTSSGGPGGAPPAAQAAVPPPAPAPAIPTLQSVFGDQPYEDGATVTGPAGFFNYNPIYFATPQTAAKIAGLVGGSVVQTDAMTANGPYAQNAPNEMIQFAGGRTVNAGLIADFYNHGYPQSYIDSLLEREIQGTI